MKWVRDLPAEELLSSLGITYQYKSHVSIDELRINDSKSNNARFGDPIDETHALTMAIAMTEGKSFPAIVCTPSYLILAGNNRVESCTIAGVKYVDMYVVDPNTTKDQQDEFCRRDNIRHGKLNTEEERIEHCVELHAKYPQRYTLKRLCDEFCGGSEKLYGKLTIAHEARVVFQLLTEERFDVANARLTRTSLAKLHQLKDNRRELRNAARVASKCRLTDTQVSELVAGTKAEPTEAKAVEFIGRYEKAHTKRAKTSKVATRLRHALTQVHNVLDNKGKPFVSLQAMGVDAEEAKLLDGKITSIIRMLQAVKKGEREVRKGKRK